MRRSFRVAGAEHGIQARYQDGRLYLEDDEGTRDLAVIALGHGEFLVRDPDGGQTRLTVARDRDTWWVHDGRRTWVLERLAPGAAGAAAGSLAAPMHGTVEQVYVEEGDRVTAGTPLLAISAMKMSLEIKAPHDGTVQELPFAAGEQVEGGAILAVVEPDGSAAP